VVQRVSARFALVVSCNRNRKLTQGFILQKVSAGSFLYTVVPNAGKLLSSRFDPGEFDPGNQVAEDKAQLHP
jgi:hypothetical protein